MKKADVVEFYSRLQAADPEPVGELHYVNPYTLLVAVALSAQATDVGVNKATRPLFKKVKTPEAMVKLGLAGLKEVSYLLHKQYFLLNQPQLQIKYSFTLIQMIQ